MNTGTIVMYGVASAPTGFLLCDGSSYLRSAFPALFSAIGTTFGSVDGTHFNVPDMSTRMPIGTGGAVGSTLGVSGGDFNHTHATAETLIGIDPTGDTINVDTTVPTTSVASATHIHAGTVPSDFVSQENPPFLVLNFIIKT